MSEQGTQPDSAVKRRDLQRRVSRWFDYPLAVLALILLGLIIIEFSIDLEDPWSSYVFYGEIGIWAVFLVTFLIELAIAPSRLQYLKENWLAAISVALPFFGFLRVLRVTRLLRLTRVLRGVNLLRAITALNRGGRAAGRFLKANRYGYILLLTGITIATAAAVGYYLERDAASSEIRSFGDALWWSATIVTTISAPIEAVTPEGRVLSFLLRIYGMAIIGYVTATFALLLIGRPLGFDEKGKESSELKRLREEVARLGELLEGQAQEESSAEKPPSEEVA